MKAKTRRTRTMSQKTACQIVERMMRDVGPDCEVITVKDGVQLAPLSWSGDVFMPTLYEALIEAKKLSE